MKNPKRLFLFAGFDKDNIVDDTVIYYVTALSKLGDVVFIMDNDLPKTEINKISKIPNVLYADGIKHDEYDFGSYKRGYLWAIDNKILQKYDWVYFVNDSVYGPMYDLKPILENLENSDSDLIGMKSHGDDVTPMHVQSWFVGFSKKIFSSDFFDNFMQKITHIPDKTSLVLKYETGLSWLILRHGFTMKTIVNMAQNLNFDDPRQQLIHGVPFVKKNAVSRLRKLHFLYPHLDDDVFLNYMVAHMTRHNITMVKDSFHDVYKLRFLGIPLLRITAKRSKIFKVYLFNRIPILKIEK